MTQIISLDIEVIKLAKSVRDNQKRYFYLANNVKNDPKLLQERKEVLIRCKQLESQLDNHLDNILRFPDMGETIQ